MFGAMFLGLPMHSRGFVVEYLHSIYAHVPLARFGIACDHQRPGNKSPGILWPALQNRKFQKREAVTPHDLLARSRFDGLRKKRTQFCQLGQHLDFVEESLRGLHVKKATNAGGDFIERSSFERQIYSALAAEQIRQ